MILDNHVQVHLGAEFGEAAQSVGGEFLLLLERAFAGGVDTDGVAAQHLRRVEPLAVVLDGLGAFGLIGRTDSAFAIDHDEQLLDAVVARTGVHLREVARVAGLVFEERVDVLDRLDAVGLSGGLREVEMVEIPAVERIVERPLGERDAEHGRFLLGSLRGEGEGRRCERRGDQAPRGCAEHRAAGEILRRGVDRHRSAPCGPTGSDRETDWIPRGYPIVRSRCD